VVSQGQPKKENASEWEKRCDAERESLMRAKDRVTRRSPPTSHREGLTVGRLAQNGAEFDGIWGKRINKRKNLRGTCPASRLMFSPMSCCPVVLA